MRDLSILIKPVSSKCNLKCEYCFYLDEAKNRMINDYGVMSIKTLENIIKKAIDIATHSITFAFQGGEPTLIGLDFYKKYIDLINTFNTKNLIINNLIQTNGYKLSDEFILFLKEHNFLVGLSIDGFIEVHDYFRKTTTNKNSFNEVVNTLQKMVQYKVNFNTLTVVNSKTSKNAKKIYEFLKKEHVSHMQFIPCIKPIASKNHDRFTLTVNDYKNFLITLFDLWYEDFKKGKYISIVQFENYVLMLKGILPNICGMSGVCTKQVVVEANGDVFPCDFYCLDEYLNGNINEVDFNYIFLNQDKSNFINESISLNEKCNKCKHVNMCRGGCKRYRFVGGKDKYLNMFCEAYYDFFEYTNNKMFEVAKLIK